MGLLVVGGYLVNINIRLKNQILHTNLNINWVPYQYICSTNGTISMNSLIFLRNKINLIHKIYFYLLTKNVGVMEFIRAKLLRNKLGINQILGKRLIGQFRPSLVGTVPNDHHWNFSASCLQFLFLPKHCSITVFLIRDKW